MELIAQSKIQAIWRLGDDEDSVELEFTYDLVNALRQTEKQYVNAELRESGSLKGTDTRKYKMTAEQNSFTISIPRTKSHFGMEGSIIADFKRKTIYFKGTLSVDSLKCPPPVPGDTPILFNF